MSCDDHYNTPSIVAQMFEGDSPSEMGYIDHILEITTEVYCNARQFYL